MPKYRDKLKEKQRILQLSLNNYIHMFEDVSQFKVQDPIESRETNRFSFKLPPKGGYYSLKDDFGKIKMQIVYQEYEELRKKKLRIIKFSFKFVSNELKIDLIDKGKKRSRERYGFHIDKDVDNANTTHPEIHFQHTYLVRPRVDLIMERGNLTEFNVLNSFLKTINLNFFKDKKRWTERGTVLLQSQLK